MDQNEEDEAEDGHMYRVNESLGHTGTHRLIDEPPIVAEEL